MYAEYYRPQNPVPNSPLSIQQIYRLMADHTYQACHGSEEPDKLILVYTDQGQGQLLCGEGEFYLEPQTALLFSTNAPYLYWTSRERWHFWWFDFFGDCSLQKGLLYQIQENDWIENLCQKAFTALQSDSAAAAAYLSCLLVSVAESTENQTDSCQELFFRAQALIKENLYHINISSMAQMLSINPRTLNNLFHQYAGCSPKVYLQDYVMDKGKYLLANTTKSIGEISDEMGFANQFHFSRIFKEKFGTAPSVYRQQCQLNWKKYR